MAMVLEWDKKSIYRRQQSIYRNKTLFASLVCLIKLNKPNNTCNKVILKANHSWALQVGLLRHIIRSLGSPSTFVQGNKAVWGPSSAAAGSFFPRGTPLGLFWSAVHCPTGLVQWHRSHLAEMTRKRCLDEVKISSNSFKMTGNAAIMYGSTGLSSCTRASLEPGTVGLTLDKCMNILSVISRILTVICNNPTARKVLKPHLDIAWLDHCAPLKGSLTS